MSDTTNNEEGHMPTTPAASTAPTKVPPGHAKFKLYQLMDGVHLKFVADGHGKDKDHALQLAVKDENVAISAGVPVVALKTADVEINVVASIPQEPVYEVKKLTAEEAAAEAAADVVAAVTPAKKAPVATSAPEGGVKKKLKDMTAAEKKAFYATRAANAAAKRKENAAAKAKTAAKKVETAPAKKNAAAPAKKKTTGKKKTSSTSTAAKKTTPPAAPATPPADAGAVPPPPPPPPPAPAPASVPAPPAGANPFAQ